jgi:hypothetical protein
MPEGLVRMPQNSTEPSDLTRRIANSIRAKYRKELIEKQRQLHTAKVLKDRAPGVWKKLFEVLSAMTRSLAAELGTPGGVDLKFANAGTSQLTITKTEMPYVLLNLHFHDVSFSISGTLAKADPRPTKSAPAVTTPLNIELSVSEDDSITAIFLGEEFPEGAGLAARIFELVFA